MGCRARLGVHPERHKQERGRSASFCPVCLLRKVQRQWQFFLPALWRPAFPSQIVDGINHEH